MHIIPFCFIFFFAMRHGIVVECRLRFSPLRRGKANTSSKRRPPTPVTIRKRVVYTFNTMPPPPPPPPRAPLVKRNNNVGSLRVADQRPTVDYDRLIRSLRKANLNGMGFFRASRTAIHPSKYEWTTTTGAEPSATKRTRTNCLLRSTQTAQSWEKPSGSYPRRKSDLPPEQIRKSIEKMELLIYQNTSWYRQPPGQQNGGGSSGNNHHQEQQRQARTTPQYRSRYQSDLALNQIDVDRRVPPPPKKRPGNEHL